LRRPLAMGFLLMFRCKLATTLGGRSFRISIRRRSEHD
jgi:hypothetical protein